MLPDHAFGCFSCWRRHKEAKDVRAHAKQLPHSFKAEEQEGPSAVPGTKAYTFEATKKTIEILRAVASLTGVPLVKEVLNVGLAMIQTCEAVNEVQDRVAGLKNRVAEFLLVIAKVARDPENPFAIISEQIMGELNDLKECLSSINDRLQAINDQSAILTTLLPDANKASIEECVTAFQDAIARFQMLRGLHAAQDLSMIQTQLDDIYGLTVAVACKVDQLQSSVNDLKAMMTRSTRHPLIALSSEIAPPPKIFFGRDDVVNRIAEHLTSGDKTRSRVCILAPGGMGKTSTALAVMKHPSVIGRFAKQHRFWVPCISANSPSTFLSLLSIQLPGTRQTNNPLDGILAGLRMSDEARIILLDNLETPWHPVEGSQASVKHILSTLDSLPHLAILVTMRSEFPPLDHWQVEALSHVEPQHSRQIYTAIDTLACSDCKLDELLQALGHLPYAITLMATLGKRSLSAPQKLLLQWNERGTDMLSNAQGGMDDSIEMSIKFVVDSQAAISLLQVLSMLPAGIAHSHLDFWVPSWQSEAIDALREAALVLVTKRQAESARLFVLPVVQSYMHRRDRIPYVVRQDIYQACCRFLKYHNSPIRGPNEPQFKRDLAAIAAQEVNIQALLTEMIQNVTDSLYSDEQQSSPRSAVQIDELDALLAFSSYQRWTRPQVEIAEHVLTLTTNAKDSRRMAEASFCLGSILARTNRSQEAHHHFNDAGKLFAALNDDLRQFYSEMEGILALMWSGETVDRHLSEAQSRWETQSNAEIMALLLYYSGRIQYYIYTDVEKLQGAMEELRQARTLLISLDYSVEAATCMWYMARCLAYLGDYTGAVEAVDQAIQCFDDLGLAIERAGLYILKARYMKADGCWDDNLYSTLQTALEKTQQFGASLNIALTLQEFGEVYIKQGDWVAARLAYEGAIKEVDRISDPLAKKLANDSQHNLDYIRVKESAQASDGLNSTIQFRVPARY